MTAAEPGFWTSTHILILLNGILAIGSVATSIAAVFAIRSSNRVAQANEVSAEQTRKAAEAATSQVEVGQQQIELGRQQIELGGQQLDQEQRALSAAVRPIISDVPVRIEQHDGGSIHVGRIDVDKQDNEITITVPVRNIGQGPAFIHAVLVTPAIGIIFDAEADVNAVPPGESSAVSLAVRLGVIGYEALDIAINGGSWQVGIRYCDSVGGQRSQTNLTVKRSGSGSYYVDEVQLYPCDEQWMPWTEPYVTSKRTPRV